jgi:hypothetical protein
MVVLKNEGPIGAVYLMYVEIDRLPGGRIYRRYIEELQTSQALRYGLLPTNEERSSCCRF